MMKNLFTALILIAFSVQAFAQCNELFISEYVEGSGNNKALELYNPTGQPVDLGSYRLIRYDNGNLVASENAIQPLPPGVFIPAYGTYVIALNLTDPNGVDQNAPIDVALQEKADTLLSDGCGTEPGNIRTMCFNGDDALTFEKNVDGTWVKVDIFACIGERPTNSSGTTSPTAGWTDLPPYSSMPVGYTTAEFGPYFMRYWTQDQTLVRKPTVTGGVTVNPQPETFNASVEWDSLPENTFDSLGFHTCVCNLAGVNEIESASKTVVYPNPANGFFNIQSALPIERVQIYSMLGQLINDRKYPSNSKSVNIDTENWEKGFYSVRIYFSGGYIASRKIVIKH
ncbi:MAG: T9SS type A sorting domain-containing protein [Bacteroidetes bacterium]|nr:T9SS type A sorting domain-containing protein [Bacteroidota bacterium]